MLPRDSYREGTAIVKPGTRKEARQEEIGAYESFAQMRALSGNIVKIHVFSTSIGPLHCRRIGGETVVNTDRLVRGPSKLRSGSIFVSP